MMETTALRMNRASNLSVQKLNYCTETVGVISPHLEVTTRLGVGSQNDVSDPFGVAVPIQITWRGENLYHVG